MLDWLKELGGGVKDFLFKDTERTLNTLLVGGSIYSGVRMRKEARKGQEARERAMMDLLKKKEGGGPRPIDTTAAPAELKTRSMIRRRRSSGEAPVQGLLSSNDGNMTKLGGY